MEKLDFITINTAEKPDSAIIWLHGLGSDGHDFESIVPELKLPESLKLKFVFPHAPVKPVSINGGLQMRAWYDIYSPDLSAQPDKDGIDESIKQVNELIDDQISEGINSDRIILAGFSQGGVIALQLGLSRDSSLSGVIALSCYIALENCIKPSAENMPKIFLAHGLYDDVVPFQRGDKAKELIISKGYSPEFHQYPMGHSLHPEEIQHISQFIQSTLL